MNPAVQQAIQSRLTQVDAEIQSATEVLYYARSRGVNGVGAGPWSSVISIRTLSGAYVRRGNAWKPVEVLVYRNGKWVPAEVYVYRNGAWVSAT